MVGVCLGARILVVLVRRCTQAHGLEEVERSRPELIIDLHADDLVKPRRPRRDSDLVALEMVDAWIDRGRRRGSSQALRAGHHHVHCPDHVEQDRSELVHNLLLLQLRLGTSHHLVPGEMVRIRGRGRILVVLIGWYTELVGSTEGNRRSSELIHDAHARDRSERERFDRVALKIIRDSRGQSGDLSSAGTQQRKSQQYREERTATDVALGRARLPHRTPPR
jgi:hypothetical protein